MYVWIYIGISVPDVGRFYPVASMGETDTFTNSAFLQKLRLCMYSMYVLSHFTAQTKPSNPYLQEYIITYVSSQKTYFEPLYLRLIKNFFWHHLVAGFHETCLICLSCIKCQITEMLHFCVNRKLWPGNSGHSERPISRSI